MNVERVVALDLAALVVAVRGTAEGGGEPSDWSPAQWRASRPGINVNPNYGRQPSLGPISSVSSPPSDPFGERLVYESRPSIQGLFLSKTMKCVIGK